MSSAEHRRELVPWALSAVVAVMAHGSLAAALMHWSQVSEPNDPAAAMVIDLAPMPVTSAKLPAEEAPPGPEQVQADASVSRPAEQTEDKPEGKQELQQVEERQPEIAAAENPEVPLAAQPPKAEEKPPSPEENQAPAPVTSAPPAPKIEEAATTAAPTQGQLTIRNSNAIPTWRHQIVSRLERHKRYPAAAQSRRERGVAQLAFRLDREGRVLTSHIIRSSGSALLDQETLNLVRRAQPFPALPREIGGPHIDLTVPIRFNMR